MKTAAVWNSRRFAVRALMIVPPILFVAFVAHSFLTIRELLSDSRDFHKDYANDLIQDYLSLELSLDIERLANCLLSDHAPCDEARWVTEEPRGVLLKVIELDSGENHPVYLDPVGLDQRVDEFFNRKKGLRTLFTERYHEPVYWFQILDSEGGLIYRSSPTKPEKKTTIYEMTRSLKEHRIEMAYNSFGPKQLYSVARTRINFGVIFFLFILAMLSVVLITRHIRQKIQLARQKTFFVSTVSHEFKTPLAVMKLAAETLARKRYKSPEEERKFLEMLDNEINRLDHLVAKILSFNKIEMNAIDFQNEETDLREILEASLEAFEVKAQAEGVNLDVSLASEPCPIVGDPDLIRHAVDNVVDNAFKYRGKSNRIDIACRRTEREAQLSVKDYGVGIEQEELPHIFKSFYRIDDAKIRGVRGSGLGLAISAHILKRSRGRLLVRSTPGEGSTFTLAFPLAS